jgi:LysR family transcriptional regulator of beta-lactamase
MSPLCAPHLTERLQDPADLLRLQLLRSYRPQDWPNWFKAAGLDVVNVRGPLFDSSLVMVQAAIRGVGVALAPHALFRRELDSGQLVRPFAIEADTDGYWLTWLKSRSPSPAMQAFRDWLASLYSDQMLAAKA